MSEVKYEVEVVLVCKTTTIFPLEAEQDVIDCSVDPLEGRKKADDIIKRTIVERAREEFLNPEVIKELLTSPKAVEIRSMVRKETA